MTDTIFERSGLRVLRSSPDGPVIDAGQNLADFVGTAAYDRVDVALVPVERLDPAFFTLSSGVAGEVAQKFVNYRVRLAIVGDTAAHQEASGPFRDWVRESNKGRHVWFLADESELDDYLGRVDGRP